MSRRPGPRPETWKTGPDPERHQQYTAWQRAHAQARFRNEAWSLTFDEFCHAWGSDWPRRGRALGSIMMVRRDPSGGWHSDNVVKITRQEFGGYQRRINQMRQQNATV